MPPYIHTEQGQYDYSKKKLPELQQRFNEEQVRHEKACELLRAKMERHESIIDNFEVEGKNDE